MLIYKSGEAPRASSSESSEGKKLNAPKEAPSSNPRAKFDKKAQLQEANRIKEFESELTDIAAKSGVNAIVLRKLQPGDKSHTSADLLPLKAKIMDALQVVNGVITPEQSRYLKGVTIVLDPFNPDYRTQFPAKAILLNDCSSSSIVSMVNAITNIFRYHENSTMTAAKKQVREWTPDVPSVRDMMEHVLNKRGSEEQIKIAEKTADRANSAAYDLDIKYRKEALRKFESGLSTQDKKKIELAQPLATRLLNRLVGRGSWLSHDGFKLDPEYPGRLRARLIRDPNPENIIASDRTFDNVRLAITSGEGEERLLSFRPPDDVFLHYDHLELSDLKRWNNPANYKNREEWSQDVKSSKYLLRLLQLSSRKLEPELSLQDKKKIELAKPLATRLLNRLLASGASLSHDGFKLNSKFPGCLSAKLSMELDPTYYAESTKTFQKVRDALRVGEDSLLKFTPPLEISINYNLLDLKDLERWSNSKLSFDELMRTIISSKSYPAIRAWRSELSP